MHLVLAVSDVDRSKAFYDQAFGWQPHLEWPGTYAELVVEGDDRLGLYRREGWSISSGGDPVTVPDGSHAPQYLYVRVDDLDAATDRLAEAGASPLSPRTERNWGDEAAYFADPDGHVVAVARRLDG